MCAIEAAQKLFPRVSFDLIFARHPLQTVDAWRAELTVKSHFFLYLLIYPFFKILFFFVWFFYWLLFLFSFDFFFLLVSFFFVRPICVLVYA